MSDYTSKSPDLIAYTVRESGGQSFFTRIGAGWKNAKGGAKIKLDAFPVNGELLLLPPRDDEAQDG